MQILVFSLPAIELKTVEAVHEDQPRSRPGHSRDDDDADDVVCCRLCVVPVKVTLYNSSCEPLRVDVDTRLSHTRSVMTSSSAQCSLYRVHSVLEKCLKMLEFGIKKFNALESA